MDAQGKSPLAPAVALDGDDASLRLTVRSEGPPRVVAVDGALHMDQGDVLHADLQHLTRSASAHVIFDLSGLAFIGSAGLAAFVAAFTEARRRDGGVLLAQPRPAIRRLLNLTHLDRLIPVYDTLEDAQRSFARSGN